MSDVLAGTPVFYPPGHDQAWPLTSALELQATPSAVPCARHHATRTLQRWNLARLTEDAAIVVTELASNAVTATTEVFQAAPVVLRLRSDFTNLVIELRDMVMSWPWPRDTQPNEGEGGRGLMIVALCSDVLVMYASPDSVCWSALEPPVFRGTRCRRVLTPPADNYTRPFLAGAESAVRRSVSRWSARRRSLWPNDLDTRRRTAILTAPRKGPHTRPGARTHQQSTAC
jgi:anti-sigma regulatory factor (Ser/Thr protein kinase)